MNKFILTLCLGASSAVSFACSPGIGGGPSGDPHCMAPILANDPYYNGSMNNSQGAAQVGRPKTTTIYLPSKYGAVAVNPDTGYVSGVLNQDSLSKAKETALAECRKRDPQGSCKIVSWVRNGCIAGAEGKAINPPGHWRSFYMGTEKGLAEAVALAKCKADSSLSNCRIILPEGCSLP